MKSVRSLIDAIKSDHAYTEAEAAELIGRNRSTVRRWRLTWRDGSSRCLGPRFLQAAPKQAVQYSGADLIAWLESHLVPS